MEFDLIRGSNDSASIASLEFFVAIEKFTPWELLLRFKFSNPLSISIGKNPDVLRITLIDPTLFISQRTGKTMDAGYEIISEIPRQYPNEEEYNLIEGAA